MEDELDRLERFTRNYVHEDTYLPEIPVGSRISKPLPWDAPNSNPLQDIKDAVAKARLEHYTQIARPNEERPDFLLSIEMYEVGLAPLPEGHIMIEHDSPGFKGQHQEGQTVEVSKADSVAIVSGGLDSTTLVYDMLDKGLTPHLLSFDYGQRHSKELIYAKATARRLGLRHDIVDLTGITHLISNSALTAPPRIDVKNAFPDGPKNNPLTGSHWKSTERKIEVPEGHYAAETMKATVVPNRNMIMLSIAAGIAVNYKYRTIGIGVHSGDHDVYPDCRLPFINAASDAIILGNEGFAEFSSRSTHAAIYAPFLANTKADIAYRALQLNVPLHLTWSCYKGGDIHCGRCSTCVERLEAIDEAIERIARLPVEQYTATAEAASKRLGDRWDNTEYADTEFWKQAVREFKEK